MLQMVSEWSMVCVIHIEQVRQTRCAGGQDVEGLLEQIGVTTNHAHQRLDVALPFERALITTVQFPRLSMRKIAKNWILIPTLNGD